MTRIDQSRGSFKYAPFKHGPFKLALILAALSLGLTCAQSEGLAAVRFVHLSPDAPLVDLILNERAEEKDLEFGQVTGYLWLDPGRHEVTVYPHRAPEQNETLDILNLENVLNSENTSAPKIVPLEPFRIAIDVEDGVYYTVVLAGFFSPPSAASAAGSLSLDIEPGTRVRVTGPRSYLRTVDESRILEGLEPGQYTVDAKRSGAKDVQYEVTVSSGEMASLGIALEEGVSAQAPANTNLSEATSEPTWQRAQLYLYEDSYSNLPAPGQAYLRIVHAAPGIGALELRLTTDTPEASDAATSEAGGSLAATQMLIENATFPNVTHYASVAAGDHVLEIFPVDGDFSLLTLPATLSPGAIYTLYLGSSLNKQVLSPVPSVDAVLRAPLSQ